MDCRIDCKFEQQPHLFVDLNAISEALTVGSTFVVPIIFRPLKEAKYRECLRFSINSAIDKKITITGQGIVYKASYSPTAFPLWPKLIRLSFSDLFQIRLVNVRDKSVDLGSVSIFNTVTSKIPVINEGLAAVQLEFDLLRNFSNHERRGETMHGYRSCTNQEIQEEEKLARLSILETKRSWTHDTALTTEEPSISEVLKVKPSSKVLLRAGQTINVLVKFSPTARMKCFASKVAARTSSAILPLFAVRGRCVGPQFRLNRTDLSFGTLVQGSAEQAKVLLINAGDMGARLVNFSRDSNLQPYSPSIYFQSGSSGTRRNCRQIFKLILFPAIALPVWISISLSNSNPLNHAV